MSADRLDTLKQLAFSLRGGTKIDLTLFDDEIAAIEWAVAAAERELVLEEANERLRGGLIAQTRIIHETDHHASRDAGWEDCPQASCRFARAALDRAGKGGTDG